MRRALLFLVSRVFLLCAIRGAALMVCLCSLLVSLHAAQAQTSHFAETIVGNTHTLVPGAASGLHSPSGVALDIHGNVYIADTGNNRVLKATPGPLGTFVFSVVADGPTNGLNGPQGVAVDVSGNVYISDSQNYRFIKETPGMGGYTLAASVATNVPPSPHTAPYPGPIAVDASGNVYVTVVQANNFFNGSYVERFPLSGGVYSSASILYNFTGSSSGLAVDGAGNAYVSFGYPSGEIAIVPATGTPSYISGLTSPRGLAVDQAGAIYVGDSGYIVKESPSNGSYTSSASANFSNTFSGVAVDSNGTVYTADTTNSAVNKEQTASIDFGNVAVGATFRLQSEFFGALGSTSSPTVVTTQGTSGLDFSLDSGSGCGGTMIYSCYVPLSFAPTAPGLRTGVAEVTIGGSTTLVQLRGIGIGPQASFTPGTISTVAGNGAACSGTTAACGDGGAATASQLFNPSDMVLDAAGNLYIADTTDNRIRKVTPAGIISTIAGTGTAGFSGDNGPATSAQLYYPSGIALDGAGNLYIADTSNHRLRMVSVRTGIISTLAGTGTADSAGDGGPATSADLHNPFGVALDGFGNLFIADTFNDEVRRISAVSGIITTVAGTHVQGFNGDSLPATTANLFLPYKVALDAAGDLFIADLQDQRIRRVDALTGIITTVAGNGTYGFSGDGGPATSATLRSPRSLAVDPAGNLYIADLDNVRIRKVEAATGLITTLAGTGTDTSTGDNGPASNATVGYPAGLTLDAAGNLFLAEFDGQRIRKITAAASPLTFTTTAVGAVSTDSPQTVTLNNIGNALLTLAPSATGGSLNPSISTGFRYAISSTCPQLSPMSTASTLAPGSSCREDLSFAPQMAGTLSGSSVVTDDTLNVAGSTQSVPLSGTATPAPVTITAASASAVYGTVTTTLTATITFPGVPDIGPVTFTVDSGAPVNASCTTTSATETCTAPFNTSTLQAGTHVITAATAADPDYFAATTTATLTITAATPTIVVAPAASTYGNATTSLTASLIYSGATGPTTVSFSIDSGPPVSGSCVGRSLPLTCIISYNTAALTAGTHTITAATPAGTNDNAATASATLTVARAAITLAASVATSTYGNSSTTLNATLAYVGPAAPTGPLTFTVDNGPATAALCTGTASPLTCTATYNTASLGGGSHTITLNDPGDTNYTAATAAAILTITPATAALNAASSSLSYGTASSTLSATVTFAGPAPPSGPITFTIDAANPVAASCAGTTTPLRCTATANTSLLRGGPHTLQAQLAADSNYTVATAAANLTVTPIAPVLTVYGSSIVFGTSPTTLTATLLYTGPTAPSGLLTFTIDNRPSQPALCAATQSPQTCTATFPSSTLSAGTHTIAATLPADANYTAASQAAIVTVTQASPVITWPTPAPVSYPAPLTASQLNASANIPGTFVYSPPAGTVPPLGWQTLSATFTPTDATDYTSATRTIILLVNPSPPICTLSVQGTPTALVVVAVTLCTDPQSQPLTSTLDWGDKTTSPAAPRTLHTYAAAGTYTVVLTTTDTSGLSTTARQPITPNQLPICTLGSIQGTSATSNAVSVTSTCTDPQGQPLTASIDWGDGTGQHPAVPSGPNAYKYTNVSGAAPYQVTLTATNALGLTGTATQSVLLLPITSPITPGASIGILANVTPQPSLAAPLLATFLCSSITVFSGGTTLTTLPAQYGITCTSPTFTVTSGNLPPVDVDIHSTASGTTVVASQFRTPSPVVAATFWAPFPGLSLLAFSTLLSAKSRRRLQKIAALLFLCGTLASCGGYFTPPAVVATPAGAYTLTLTEVLVCPASTTSCPAPPTGFVQTSLIKPLTIGKP